MLHLVNSRRRDYFVAVKFCRMNVADNESVCHFIRGGWKSFAGLEYVATNYNSEIFGLLSVKQIQEAMRPYRVACLIVTVLSLVLLMVVVVLLVKSEFRQ